MAKILPELTDDLRDFVREQPMFFVATAPLTGDGHVNLSPKGLDTFRVLSPTRVAYLDMTGSGNETAAHLGENGRITFMFCAFKGRPRIVRLFGRGRSVLPGSEEWTELAPHFHELRGARQVIVADLHRIQTSCGYAVPVMETVEQRDTLLRWVEAKDDAQLAQYREKHNTRSIDGIEVPVATD